MKILTLIRKTDNGIQTTGEIFTTDAVFRRKTLERPWKNNASNISCIPKGQYLVKWTRSIKFPLGSYQVMDVPKRFGIRIHKGNFFFDVEGCILLGSSYSDINHDGIVDIINSTQTIKEFETFMGRQDFTLIIQ